MTTLKYTNALDFSRQLMLDTPVPGRDNKEGRTNWYDKEEVGVGDGTTVLFYLDNGGIINGTLLLYTGGATEVLCTTLLIETTHYTVNYDSGIITLTTAGKTSVGTTKIYASYSYNKFLMSNTLIESSLERAEAYVDSYVESVFYDGTAATPTFGTVSNEYLTGLGNIERKYSARYYPINTTTTTLNGSVSAGATTITVTSTNGFPSSGVFGVESNKITYTGKTSTSFTGCTGAVAHATGKVVTSFVIEYSLDAEGNEPTYSVLDYTDDYAVDFVAGMFMIHDLSYSGTLILDNLQPQRGVWQRVRLNYQYGYNTIPKEVIGAVHLIAARELFSSQVLNALMRGSNGFSTESSDLTELKIEKLLNKYKLVHIANCKP